MLSFSAIFQTILLTAQSLSQPLFSADTAEKQSPAMLSMQAPSASSDFISWNKIANLPDISCALDAEGQSLRLSSRDSHEKGVMSLSFDDGPFPGFTSKILDELAKNDQHATFFVVGRMINSRSFSLIQRMVDEGHEIGNHSFDHDLDLAYHGDADSIEGQFRATQITVDLALIAATSEEYIALTKRIFSVKHLTSISLDTLHKNWRDYQRRYELLLSEYGYKTGESIYPIRYSRPPGGRPYLTTGKIDPVAKANYEEALRRINTIDVLWHGSSGDADPVHRKEESFLLSSLSHAKKTGGIVLIHDMMNRKVLTNFLAQIASDPNLKLRSLDALVEDKYHCSPAEIRRARADKKNLESAISTLFRQESPTTI